MTDTSAIDYWPLFVSGLVIGIIVWEVKRMILEPKGPTTSEIYMKALGENGIHKPDLDGWKVISMSNSNIEVSHNGGEPLKAFLGRGTKDWMWGDYTSRCPKDVCRVFNYFISNPHDKSIYADSQDQNAE